MVPGSLNDDGPKQAAFPDIPGYQIEGVVGRGATGIVYRAKQLAFGRRVALKVLHPSLVGSGRAVRRLQREAQLAARLTHPNLVSSIDMGQAEGRWWHAMELVEGPSLAILIHRETMLSERTALRLFAPLADALGHMADSGVVHRDIKPGNILIERGGRPLLVDFGLAFGDGDPAMTRPGGTLGTPHYVSPEQARDPTSADTRSDIWSFGATLYHALCGAPPFEGESVAEILSGVLYAEIKEPRTVRPELSKGISLVLRKCLTREPERRYQHPDELLGDLERLRERRGVKVRRYELDPVAAERTRRRWAGLVAGLAVALGALFLAWKQPWRDPTAGLDDPAVAVVSYEPLDELSRRVRGDPATLGQALRDLEQLEPSVPADHVQLTERTREILDQRLASEVGRRQTALSSTLTRDLRENLYGGALARLAGFEQRVGTELGLDDMQLVPLGIEAALEPERQRVLAALEAHSVVLRRSVANYFDATIGEEVERLVRAQQWSEAQSVLEQDPALWLSANVALPDLPPEAFEDLEQHLAQVVFAGERGRLAERWGALDEQLAVFVATESERLEQALIEGRAPGDPAQALQAAFDAELEGRGIARAAMLDEVSKRALNALAENRADLSTKAEDLLRRDSRAWLAERDEDARDLMQRRRFSELAEFWTERAEQSVAAPVQHEVELRRREAELLAGLLVSAGERLRSMRGQRVQLYLGGVLARGELALVGDPIEDGFELDLESGARSPRLRLVQGPIEDGSRLLGPESLERLFDLESRERDASPEHRLAFALFCNRNGEPGTALEYAGTLASDGGLSELSSGHDRELLLTLIEELESLRQRGAEEQARDLEEAQALLSTLTRMQRGDHTSERKAALEILNRLLGPLYYLDFVQERKQDLRQLRRRFEDPQARTIEERFARTYDPTRLEINEALQSALVVFDFSQTNFRSNDVVGAWRRPQSWIDDSGGWSAAQRVDRQALLDETLWPRLLLVEPLVFNHPGGLAVRFRLRQRDAEAPELLLLSVAGWHVAFATAAGGEPRWRAETGGPEALAELVDDVLRGEGRPFPGFERGKTYSVELRISGQSGRLRVSLAEVTGFGRNEGLRPLFDARTSRLAPQADTPGTQSLVVRSLEPVRLERVEIEGAHE